jgi:hypothetical protein
VNLDYVVSLLVSLGLLADLTFALLKRRSSDMTLNGWLQIGFFLLTVLAVTPVLGRFMTRVFTASGPGWARCYNPSSVSSID